MKKAQRNGLRLLLTLLLPLLFSSPVFIAHPAYAFNADIERTERQVAAAPAAEIERLPSPGPAAADEAEANANAIANAHDKATPAPANSDRPQIVILLDTGLGSAVIESAAADVRRYASAADIEVLVRGLPVKRTETLMRTDMPEVQRRLAPLLEAGVGATIDPGRFSTLLSQVEIGMEAGGRLDPKTDEVFQVMTSSPTAPAVWISLGRHVYAVSGTASISEALAKWRRTLEDAPEAFDPDDIPRLAPLKCALADSPLGRPVPAR